MIIEIHAVNHAECFWTVAYVEVIPTKVCGISGAILARRLNQRML